MAEAAAVAEPAADITGTPAPDTAPPADPPEEPTGAEPGAGAREAAPAEPPPAAPPKAEELPPPSLDALRATVTDESHRKVLERFNSLDDIAKAVLDLRRRESTPRVPGKDASEDDIAAYRKAIGVPEDASGYEFTVVEGREATEDDKAFQAQFGEAFHAAGLTKAQAQTLNTAWNEYMVAAEEAQAAADAKFVEESDAALRAKWGGDYDRNKTLALRGAQDLLGESFDGALKLELAGGRMLLDHPVLLEAFAKAGAEMAEPRLGPRMEESERDSLTEQIADVGRRKHAAYDRGDTETVSRLDAEEARLIAKRDGDRGIVGADNRAV